MLGVGTGIALLLYAGLLGAPTAFAAQSQVDLGNATPFAVLAGTTVTNTGPTVISGDLGVSPGTAVTHFPPGQVINGTQHDGDAVALAAQSDLTTAYNDAAGRTPYTVQSTDLGGTKLAPGVYHTASAMSLTGTVTLDGQGDPNAVFIFQAGSTLITASNSTVALTGKAQACNVFWQVGSSATLGTYTTFVGSILALTSATVQTGTTVAGRVLARNGQVSLDDNVITASTCAPTITSVTPSSGATAGGTVITITGTNLGGVTSVTVGGSPVTVTGGTSTTITGTTPAGRAGPVNVVVTTPGGTVTDTGGYTYVVATSSTSTTATTAIAVVIPKGAPQTGAGGASHSGLDGLLIAIGAISLAGAAATTAMAIRKRRPTRFGRHG